MSKSYERINYLLRFKKQIERKIIIEALQCLGSVFDIKKYRYLGFGSIYFADFILFHKYLNINKLTSIDSKVSDEQRFKFNLPYAFIDFHLTNSDYFLRNDLNWKEELLIWLDYDSSLSFAMLCDIEYVASKAKPLDLFIITVAGGCDDPENFQKKFHDFLPSGLKLPEIKSEHSKVLCGVLKAAMDHGVAKQVKDIKFLPLFNFEYSDGSKMHTYGGIFYKEDCESIKKQVAELSYFSLDNRTVKIDCPLLTPKEKSFLDSQIQKGGDFKLGTDTEIGLSASDLEKYKKYYKFYPQFFESIY